MIKLNVIVSIFFSITSVTVLGAFSPALADNEKAKAAFDAGSYQEARDEWQKSIAKGDGAPEAAFRLGQMAEKGLGRPQNLTDALEFYKTAAQNGNAAAQLQLGLLYSNTKGPVSNMKDAEKMLRAAADRKDVSAADEDYVAAARVKLGDLLLEGAFGAQDAAQATHWYSMAGLDAGVSAAARYKLAQLYESGTGVKKDACMASKLYENVKEGYADAIFTALSELKELAKTHIATIKQNGSCGPIAFDKALAELQDAIKGQESVRKDAAVQRLCDSVQNIEIPASDMPSPDQSAALNNCESDALYYDYQGKGADFTKARQCAITELPKDDLGPLRGASILMMVYANGQGTSRNWPLAFRFACQMGGAAFEISSRMQHLSEMASNQTSDPIDICDDITSGYMMGFCASIGSEKEQHQREAKLDNLLKDKPESVKAKYKKLHDAATRFIKEAANSESDMSGTARGAIFFEHQDDIWTEFMDIMNTVMIHQFEKDSKLDSKTEDKFLNDIYQKVMKSPSFEPNTDDPYSSKNAGTITTTGIRTVQRLWIDYRNAWVDFAKTIDPNSADVILALVTSKRKDDLASLLENYPSDQE